MQDLYGALLALFLGAVLTAGLLAVANTGGIQRTTNDLVTETGEITDTTTADEHNGVLLQGVTHTGDVRAHFDARAQTHTCNLAKSRVRLLRCVGVHADTHTTTLRSTLQCGRARLAFLGFPTLADQLLDGGHKTSLRNCLKTYWPDRPQPGRGRDTSRNPSAATEPLGHGLFSLEKTTFPMATGSQEPTLDLDFSRNEPQLLIEGRAQALPQGSEGYDLVTMTMRRPAGFTTRRHRPSAAAVAYSHAHVITQNADVAASIASAALRRGAHSRLAVIAHARHQALEHARRTPPVDSVDPAASDLRALALQLASTRPPLERAIVDLELRYALDTSSFARVLGLTNNRATKRSAAVAQTWTQLLDPAVMAWLGPGSCDRLSVLLTQAQLWPRSSGEMVVSSVDTTDASPLLPTGTDGAALDPQVTTPSPVAPVTVAALLDIAPAVNEHATDCDICGDRLRMLTSVRSMMGQAPVENVPAVVAEAAKTAYRRIPTPLPPSIEPHRIDISRFRIPAFSVAGIATLAVIGFFLLHRDQNDSPSQADRVAELVNAAPQSRLLATPSIVTSNTGTAALANTSSAPLTWHSEVNVPWITLEPSSGTLAPNQSISIAIRQSEPANNKADATITIRGFEGSTQTLRYSTSH